jgi:hypothetical protein
MDIKELKLDLIKAISQCNDRQLLQTVAQVMQLAQGGSPEASQRMPQELPPWQQPDTGETEELQQSINDIFKP